MEEFLASYPFLLPLIIFFGRICDVTLGTLRIVFVSRGVRNMAPIIGFCEIFIWIVIISQVFKHADGVVSYLAYAAGYATGTYLGIMMEEKIGFGFIIFRIFTMKNGNELNKILNEAGLGTTVIHGEGSVTEIDIIETVVSRKDTKRVEHLIQEFDPKSFYLIEDVRAKQKGIFSRQAMKRMFKQ